MKLWFYLYKEEILRGLKLIIPFTLLFVLYRQLPYLARNYSCAKFNTEAMGYVENVSIKKSRRESLAGSKLVDQYYILNYNYSINNNTFCKSETINISALTLKQHMMLKLIEAGDSLKVRYNSKNIKSVRIDLK